MCNSRINSKDGIVTFAKYPTEEIGKPCTKTKSERIDDEVRRRLGVDEQFQPTEPGERLAESWREANKDLLGPLRKSDFQPDQRLGKQLLCRSMRAEI